MRASIRSTDKNDDPNHLYASSNDWGWQDWVLLGGLALALLWAVRELWKPGLPNSTDLLLSVYRVFELNQAWHAGVFFPRMGPNLNFGYGAPLFQFYPPLVSYGIFAFYSLGFGYLEATKLMLSLSLFLGSAGVYVYVRWLTRQRFPALLSALFYLYSPYILLVTYERGAAAEALALALLPWLLCSVHRLIFNPGYLAIILTATSIALLMLAHNITALFVLPAVAFYMGLLLIYECKWQAWRRITLAFLLGLGLSAFYWLPAILELGYTKTEATMLVGEAQVETWLLPTLLDVIQPSLLVAYLGDDRFHFALWAMLTGAAALLGWRIVERRLRFTVALLFAGWLTVLLFQLQISAPIWQHVPLLRFIQFPWRLYGIATLCWVLIGGLFFASARLRRGSPLVYFPLAITITLLTIFFSTYQLHVEELPFHKEMNSQSINLPALFEIGRFETALFNDYTPRWMHQSGGIISQPRGMDEPISSSLPHAPVITVVQERASQIELTVNALEPFPLHFHKIFFPGWTVSVDGAALPTSANGTLGLVSAIIPAGEHKVQIAFAQTPIRRWSDLLSLLLLLFVLIWGFSSRVPGTDPIDIGISNHFLVSARHVPIRLILLAILLVLSVGIALYRGQVKASATHRPLAYHANLDNTIHLVGYELEQTTVAAGESLKLRLYWFATQTPTVSLKVFVHLLQRDDSGRVAQLDHEPMIGYNPTSRWEPGELIPDSYELPLDARIAPGNYLLAVGMYDPQSGQNLPVISGPNTLPGDRMVLSNVEVQ